MADIARWLDDGGRLIDDVAEEATNLHHTIPREIRKSRSTGQSMLPDHLIEHPDIVGRVGNPNRWRIPEELHSQIHGSRRLGGHWNQRWKEELRILERQKPDRSTWTADDILAIRDRLVNEFGLDQYRP